MYTLANEYISYSLNENGFVCSVFNRKFNHEYCRAPGELFRLIYKIEDFEERTVDAKDQAVPLITVSENVMQVVYPQLNTPDGVQQIRLVFTLTLDGKQLSVVSDIENNSDMVEVMELQTTALAGIGGLSEDPSSDALIIPFHMGDKVQNPYCADFFKHHAKLLTKKYERPDNRHSDLDMPYPGSSCMQWFSLYNENESIYVGNHDVNHLIICQHVERRVTDNTLRMGICQYPFLEKGESFRTPPIVYALLEGDWHSGSKLYRKWMDEEYGWKAPIRPQWAQEFEGWLRCIFRVQSGEFNFRFTDIPRMFDEVQAAGLNTLFVLGWPQGGFGRLRPDYWLDPRYIDDFKKGVEYVHSKGGKLFMYVSYFAVDEDSKYFREEGGAVTLMKDIWGRWNRFSETYSVDGTYRKMINTPRDQLCTCSGSYIWHEKMKKSADYCLELGADGVLYDLGGYRPLFCCAEGHDHKKPNECRSSKANRYKELRANIRAKGERIIMEEHCIDIYSQHMDIVQPSAFAVRGSRMPEMFKYTFPEIRMTNRNNALDEENYLDNCNYSFVYNLAFDLSIFRCSGLPSDIPNYTAYMKELIALRQQHSKFFHYGKFVDEDGFRCDKKVFTQKAYLAEDGSLGVAVWNSSNQADTVTYSNDNTGSAVTVTLEKDSVCFIEL